MDTPAQTATNPTRASSPACTGGAYSQRPAAFARVIRSGRTGAALLTAALLAFAALLAAAPARAQDTDPARPAAFVPPSQAWARLQPPPTQREDRVRAALLRAVPAPRVAALVQEILPPDVQVAVVHNPPGGLGAYYPGLAVAGYDHVYANERERRLLSGPWGLIVLDARLEEQAARETIAFVLAHEYGHHRLGRGHTEADADAHARYMLTRLGLWSPRTAENAFELAVGLPFARRLVPAVGERLRALEEAPPLVAVQP
jgi:Zn-dependent protease with chaperone function